MEEVKRAGAIVEEKAVVEESDTFRESQCVPGPDPRDIN